LLGKLLPIWQPSKPNTVIISVTLLRVVVFVPAILLCLGFSAPGPVFLVLTFLMSLSTW
jgi:hypothetical protein